MPWPHARVAWRPHSASLYLARGLRNLGPEQAAALLLAEVYGFTVGEAAEILGATFGQAKNWIQTARARMQEKYAATCALIAKQGVCYQCVELSEFFTGRREDPLDGTTKDIELASPFCASVVLPSSAPGIA